MRNYDIYKYYLIATILIVFVSAALLGGSVFASKTIKFTKKPTEAPQEQLVFKSIYYKNAEPDPTEDEKKLKILFVGDIMLGRHVEALIMENGLQYPFEKIQTNLAKYDLVLGNLEGPINENHQKTPDNSVKFSFKPEIAGLLKENKVNLVSLANNHTLDMGKNNYLFTQQKLKENEIDFFGHSTEISENSILKKEIKDEKIIFLGFNQTFTSSFDEKKAIELIKKTETENPNYFLVVVIHWGEEYKLNSNSIQKNLAHSFIDNGADLIIGGHPHVAQEIEKYQDKYIFYSLGNFIFDQYFSKDTQEALTVSMIFEEDKIRFEILPIEIIRSQPIFVSPLRKKLWFEDYNRKRESNIKEDIEKRVFYSDR